MILALLEYLTPAFILQRHPSTESESGRESERSLSLLWMSEPSLNELDALAQQIIIGMTESVDDCDRAMEQIYSSSDTRQIATGVSQMRERLLERFEKIGLRSFGRPGDVFDANLHQAVDVVDTIGGGDPKISKVHQRGWCDSSGRLIRPAMVTVTRGSSS